MHAPSRSRLPPLAVAAALAVVIFVVVVVRPLRAASSGVGERLTVYVFPHDWCELFHFGAVLRMCADSASRCDIVRGWQSLLPMRGSTSGQGSTFGLPVVSFGGLNVSQSVAGTIFAGEQLGLGATVMSGPKAIQLMLDMRDFIDNAGMGNTGYDGSTFVAPRLKLDAIIASGRFDQFFSYFERNMAGPWFFPGDGPSYVDYYFASMIAWVGHMLQTSGSAREWPGDLFANYTKVRGVLAALER